MGEGISQLLADYMNLVQACSDIYPRFSDMLKIHHGDTLETHRSGINQFLAHQGYTDAQIARFWSGEDQLTSS